MKYVVILKQQKRSGSIGESILNKANFNWRRTSNPVSQHSCSVVSSFLCHEGRDATNHCPLCRSTQPDYVRMRDGAIWRPASCVVWLAGTSRSRTGSWSKIQPRARMEKIRD